MNGRTLLSIIKPGWKAIRIVLLCVGLVAGMVNQGACENFGTGIVAINPEKPYVGDFNGDGIADNLFLLELRGSCRISDDSVLINPWSSGGNVQPFDESLGLGIVHGGKQGTKTVLYDPDFLSTPIWKETPAPVSVLKRESEDYPVWKKSVSDLDGDAIVLETEAGIDILLYFNGTTYTIFWPEEEP